MKKIYNKPETCIVTLRSYCILSGSGNPEVNVYDDEAYSPGNAYARRSSGGFGDDIDEETIN